MLRTYTTLSRNASKSSALGWRSPTKLDISEHVRGSASCMLLRGVPVYGDLDDGNFTFNFGGLVGLSGLSGG
jgi:hypothetical protein